MKKGKRLFSVVAVEFDIDLTEHAMDSGPLLFRSPRWRPLMRERLHLDIQAIRIVRRQIKTLR
jgi:hypothetical protein